jgi:hypothetical protein
MDVGIKNIFEIKAWFDPLPWAGVRSCLVSVI